MSGCARVLPLREPVGVGYHPKGPTRLAVDTMGQED